MNEIEVVKAEVMPIPTEARMILVTDQPSLEKANNFFLVIRGLRKKIADTFNPIIEAAHKAHKEALKQKAGVEEPLIIAEKWLNGQVTAYSMEQERKRREEEEILRQAAIKAEMERRKKEEEVRVAQAAALEAAGAKEEANAIITEAMEEIEKPLEVYVPPPDTPKVKLEGMAVVEYWSAEITDLKALCRAVGEGKCPTAYVEANMTTLNTLSRRLKNEMQIPGVKAVCRTSSKATGR